MFATRYPLVTLPDALKVCELMARDGDQRFSRAATRWLERFGAETKAGFPRSSLRRRLSVWLWENPESKKCQWRPFGALA